MKEIIPIFPLNLVMFPGAVYPLHIFEERYQKLLAYCRKSGEGFGVVSKIEDDNSDIGCHVKLVEVINTYENGSLDIVVKGTERFRVLNTSTHPDGYIVSQIEKFEDTVQTVTAKVLVDDVLEKFKNILRKTNIDLSQNFWKNLDNTNLKSFKIAEKSGLNLKQQQSLLASRNETERIKMLIEHFDFLEGFIGKSDFTREMVMNDGYLN